jgi:hypothetical protein
MSELYLIPNGPSPTTAAQATVALAAATIKSILQVKLGAVVTRAKIVEWGVSFDAAADAAKVKCELLCTGAIKATVTEHLAAGIINLDPLATAPTDDSPFAFTASGDETGYDASAEGSITVTRMHDFQLVSPAGAYVKQWPLGREPIFKFDEYLRIRCTAPAVVNVYGYVIVEV